MGKFMDSIYFALAISVLTFVSCIKISHKIWLSLLVSITLSLVVVLSYNRITIYRDKKQISHQNFDTYMIVQGLAYQLSLLHSLYPEGTISSQCIVLNNSIIVPVIKFSELSKDDIIKVRKLAEEKDVKDIYIISTSFSRSALNLASLFTTHTFHFVRTKYLYNLLKSNSLLPKIPKIKRKSVPKLPMLIRTMFSKKLAPRYLFTALVLASIGVFTPLSTYYFVLSSISAIMSIISLFSHSDSSIASTLPPR